MIERKVRGTTKERAGHGFPVGKVLVALVLAALSTAALCTDVLSAPALSGSVAVCDIHHARTAALILAAASVCGLAWTFCPHRWTRARS